MGSAVTIVFAAYSMVVRHQHSEPVIAPSLSNPNSTTTTLATPTNPTPKSSTPSSSYKDGTYTGSVENAFYGNVQVSATIRGSKLSAVNFLESPNDNPNSIYVNQTAIPYLKQEAVQAQSSHVNIVTGATLTSQAFMQSLARALSQAQQGS